MNSDYLSVGLGVIVALLLGYTLYLKGEIKLKEAEILEANSWIERQNAAIKENAVAPKISKETQEKIEKIKYIKIKDGSCEAELEGLKRLFDSAF